MSDAADDIALGILKALVVAVPSFASWLGGLLDGEAEPSPFSLRVRDILPERSKSREAAESIGGGQ